MAHQRRFHFQVSVLVAIVGLTILVPRAFAQTAPPQPAPPPAAPVPPYPPPPAYALPPPYPYGYNYPPPYPPQAPGYHLHDGFLLRLGFGVAHMSLSATVPDGRTGTLSGGGMGLDITVGGALRPGLIVALSINGGSFDDPIGTGSDGTTQVSQGITADLQMITVLIDHYPDPQGGFHFGGDAGVSTLRFTDRSSKSTFDQDRYGFAGALHVGYEWWISDNWSAGILGRLTYMSIDQSGHLIDDGSPITFTLKGFLPSLTASFTYN